MILYALRRLIYLVPVAFGVSLLVFALVHLAPGDPISAIVPPDAPRKWSTSSRNITASTSRCRSSTAAGCWSP
jgi:peptide/nickel transport system permease protein